jgi:hypothetical protein
MPSGISSNVLWIEWTNPALKAADNWLQDILAPEPLRSLLDLGVIDVFPSASLNP